jgi:hypothetical protein
LIDTREKHKIPRIRQKTAEHVMLASKEEKEETHEFEERNQK